MKMNNTKAIAIIMAVGCTLLTILSAVGLMVSCEKARFVSKMEIARANAYPCEETK